MTIVLVVLAAWIALAMLVVVWMTVLAAKGQRALRAQREAHYDRVARFAAGQWDDELAPLRARRAGDEAVARAALAPRRDIVVMAGKNARRPEPKR